MVVDLWHWKDDYVQTIQRVRAEQDRNRSYRAVYDLQSKKFVQLADETMESISPSNDGSYAIGSDNRKYRVMSDHDPGYSDYYLINTSDGSRKPILSKQRGNVSLSPNAKFALYFDGKDWYSYSVADGTTANLTKNIRRVSTTKSTIHHQLQVRTAWLVGPKTKGRFDLRPLRHLADRAGWQSARKT